MEVESLKSNPDVQEAEKRIQESIFSQAIDLFEKALKNSNCDDALKETKIALQMSTGSDMEMEAIRIHALRCMIYVEMMSKTTDPNLLENYSTLYVEDLRKAVDILKNWKYLPPIEQLELNQDISHPKAAMLILHGYGADATDLRSGIGEVIQQMLPDVKLIFPQGAFPLKKFPWMPFVGYSWYPEDVPRDSYSWYFHAPRDLLCYAQIYKLMDELKMQGIKNEKVALLGFSLGGTVESSVAQEVDDLIDRNSSLGNFGTIAEPVVELLLKQASGNIPVLIGAGTVDDKVDVSQMRSLHEIFKGHSFNVEYHEYQMGHQIIPEQIRDIVSFVRKLT